MTSLNLDVALRAYVPAFEQIGKPLPAQITVANIAKARQATGLTWEPATEPQYRIRHHGGAGPDGAPGGYSAYEEVPEHKYVTRGPGGAILDSANASYHVFTNQELFEVAETLRRRRPGVRQRIPLRRRRGDRRRQTRLPARRPRRA